MEDKGKKKLDEIRELIGDENFEELEPGKEEGVAAHDVPKERGAGFLGRKRNRRAEEYEDDDYDEDDEYEDDDDEEEFGGKKKHPWRTALLILLAIIVVLSGAVIGITISSLNRINRSDWSNEEPVDPTQEDFEPDDDAGDNTMDPEEVDWDKVNVFSDPNVKNILLIGQDRRPGERRARSDSMIICSLNEKTGVITLVSLMRDMYVPIPGYSDNRINAAYAFGGMTLLNQVIKEDFGIIIDGNVEVDFNGFMEVMGMIAPLNIELNSAEAAYMHLPSGVNALNAQQLLTYARVRSIGASDYERTDRQRRVLTAAFNKMRSLSVTEIYNVVNAALPCVTTDMSNLQIMGYVSTVIAKGVVIGGNYRLPASGTYSDQVIRGMMVLVPDLPTNSRILQRYLYGDLVEKTGE